MKVTLYMAISIDGYIAKSDMSTNWVSEVDFKMLNQKIQEHKCVILGNTTFKEFWSTSWVINIVVSKNTKENSENINYAVSVWGALEICKDLGLETPLLIWGWLVNASFLKENEIDEIILSIHPIILWKGIKIFEELEKMVQLTHIKTSELDEWLILIHYEVKK